MKLIIINAVSDGRNPLTSDEYIVLFYINFALFYLIPVVSTLFLYVLILQVVRKKNSEITDYLSRDRTTSAKLATKDQITSKVDADIREESDIKLQTSAGNRGGSADIRETMEMPQRQQNRMDGTVTACSSISASGTSSRNSGRMRVYGAKGVYVNRTASIDIQRLKKFKQVRLT